MKIIKVTRYECDSCHKVEDVTFTNTLNPQSALTPNATPPGWVSLLVIKPPLMAPSEADPSGRTLHCGPCFREIARLIRNVPQLKEGAA